jgi:hypothetical protein
MSTLGLHRTTDLGLRIELLAECVHLRSDELLSRERQENDISPKVRLLTYASDYNIHGSNRRGYSIIITEYDYLLSDEIELN